MGLSVLTEKFSGFDSWCFGSAGSPEFLMKGFNRQLFSEVINHWFNTFLNAN
jgi:hypothetical protein